MSETIPIADETEESERHRSGRCVVALPADDEPIHAFGEEDKHLTLLWLGTPEENAELDMEAVKSAVEAYAAETPPFIGLIEKSGDLGEEGAKVSFLAPDDVPHHDQLIEQSPVLADAVAAVEQFPTWTPHVTLGYPEPEEELPVPTGTILFDRIAVWDGAEQTEYPFQRITALPVTDVFTLKRSIALTDKLPSCQVREAARRVLTRRARDLNCVHAIPTQWIKDRQSSFAFRTAVLEKYKEPSAQAAAAAFTAKSLSSGVPDTILRAAYMRAVRDFAMLSPATRPPLTREQFAQARVNSLIRLASGDLSARSDDMDLLDRMKESS